MKLIISPVDFEFVKSVLFKSRAKFISGGEDATHTEGHRKFDRECAKMCESAVAILQKSEADGKAEK